MNHTIPSGIESEVCADIAARQRLGLSKYGMSVADNPADLLAWLQHAYEETLDNAVYLKKAMHKLKEKLPTQGGCAQHGG